MPPTFSHCPLVLFYILIVEQYCLFSIPLARGVAEQGYLFLCRLGPVIVAELISVLLVGEYNITYQSQEQKPRKLTKPG